MLPSSQKASEFFLAKSNPPKVIGKANPPESKYCYFRGVRRWSKCKPAESLTLTASAFACSGPGPEPPAGLSDFRGRGRQTTGNPLSGHAPPSPSHCGRTRSATVRTPPSATGQPPSASDRIGGRRGVWSKAFLLGARTPPLFLPGWRTPHFLCSVFVFLEI